MSGGPPTLPADPAAGMDDVEWSLAIEDYSVTDGLTWPHRLTVKVAGAPFEDVKIGAFKINPKIDPKTFAPRQ